MQRRRRHLILLPMALLAVVLLCNACGQKGPLYLPEPSQDEQSGSK